MRIFDSELLRSKQVEFLTVSCYAINISTAIIAEVNSKWTLYRNNYGFEQNLY